MADTLSPERRSRLMASIGQKNTAPEIRVRKQLHALGYRFRIHRKDLPGSPDIVLPRYNLCIFVNGCFWHQHPSCDRATLPTSNSIFWRDKFKKNSLRDQRVKEELENIGWRVAVIWECQTQNIDTLNEQLRKIFLN